MCFPFRPRTSSGATHVRVSTRPIFRFGESNVFSRHFFTCSSRAFPEEGPGVVVVSLGSARGAGSRVTQHAFFSSPTMAPEPAEAHVPGPVPVPLRVRLVQQRRVHLASRSRHPGTRATCRETERGARGVPGDRRSERRRVRASHRRDAGQVRRARRVRVRDVAARGERRRHAAVLGAVARQPAGGGAGRDAASDRCEHPGVPGARGGAGAVRAGAQLHHGRVRARERGHASGVRGTAARVRARTGFERVFVVVALAYAALALATLAGFETPPAVEDDACSERTHTEEEEHANASSRGDDDAFVAGRSRDESPSRDGEFSSRGRDLDVYVPAIHDEESHVAPPRVATPRGDDEDEHEGGDEDPLARPSRKKKPSREGRTSAPPPGREDDRSVLRWTFWSR